jgi:hypothetical protein
MLHIFIIPAGSLLVNLQALKDKAAYNFTPSEIRALFNGKVFVITIKPESVLLN